MNLHKVPKVEVEVKLGNDIKPFVLKPSMLEIDPETLEEDLAQLPAVIATIGTIRSLAAKKVTILETATIPRELGLAAERVQASRTKVSDTHTRKLAESDEEVVKLRKELARLKYLQSVIDSYYFAALSARDVGVALLPRVR